MAMPPLSERAQGLPPSELGRILAEAATMDNVYRFGGGYPPNDVFDAFAIPALTNATDRVLSDPKKAHEALQYGKVDGLTSLQKVISERVSAQIKKFVDPNRVIITVGLQEGLRRLGEVLLDENDIVVADRYPYAGTMDAFHGIKGVEIWGLHSDQNGVIPASVDEAVRIARDEGRIVKMMCSLYVGNPDTSVVLSDQRAQELVEKSQEYNLAFIADRAYEGLLFDEIDNSAPPILKYSDYGIDGWTSSKAVAPGIRVGWFIAPLHLIPALKGLKTGDNLCTSPFSQALIAEYMRSGDYDNNLPKIRYVYQRRRDAMDGALKNRQHLRGNSARGGMFNYAENPDGLNTQIVADPVLQRSKVLYLPGKACHPDRWMPGAAPSNPDSWIRLNFSHEPEERIYKGIDALDQTLGEIAQEIKATM